MSRWIEGPAPISISIVRIVIRHRDRPTHPDCCSIYRNQDPTALGVYKTPVAAGRGSGNLSYAIVPGKPEKSILVYRMNTTDPGIAMPELGREQIHSEGVVLISEWIRQMKQ